MSTLRVVNTTGKGIDTRIYLDDEEVSDKFESLVVTASTEGDVWVSAKPLVFEVDKGTVELTSTTKLVFFNETEELLIKHGWTPPE